jgi:branched-chain amino acid transport system substrate-binding protein
MTDPMSSPSKWQAGRVIRRLARREFARGAAAAALSLPVAFGVPAIGRAAGTQTFTIGMDFALTGAEAEEATTELDGAQLAVEEANAKHAVPGYEFRTIVLNDATATAGGYDPAQAATNARNFAENSDVVAVVGPIDSGAAKAMLPILSQAGLAMVAGSTTSPDLTNPKFADQTRQNGVTLVFFRTCGNEAFVEPGMVNFFYGQHNVRSAYVVDDGGAGGQGIADAFQAAAEQKGIKVLGRDTINAKAFDYTPILTKISGLKPDLLEYGGITLAGAKLAKQAYDILPHAMLRSDASGIYEGDFLKAAGFPAAEGWYATSAAPHVFDTPAGQAWQRRYVERWHTQPSDYALTTYDAAAVVVDGIARVKQSGQPMTRANVRAAIEATNMQTLQGSISFDKNGDLQQPVISIFQVTHNASYPDSDLSQFKYVGTTTP